MGAEPATVKPEGWSETADDYDGAAKTNTYPAATAAIEMADKILPFDNPATLVLDNGAGSGALSLELSKQFPSTSILATDIAAEMLAKIDSAGLPNIETRVVDAMELQPSLSSDAKVSKHNGFSHSFGMFMVQFVPDPDECIRQMVAVTRPGGLICLGVWGERIGIVSALMQTFTDIDPSYKGKGIFDDLTPFPQTEDALCEKIKTFGLRDVQAATLTLPMKHDEVETLANYVLEGSNPAVARVLEEWKAAHPEIGLEPVRKGMIRCIQEGYKNDIHFLDTDTVIVMGVVQ